MTEAEWLEGSDTLNMLWFLSSSGRISERKLCYFAVACCRTVDFGRSAEFAHILDELEKHIDKPNKAGRRRIRKAVREIRLALSVPSEKTWGVSDFCWLVEKAASESYAWAAQALPEPPKADWLRCLSGNPFRPAAIDPRWLDWNNGTVVKLTRTIYEDRRWDLMPILGDALEGALCDNPEMLEHCRGPGPHARGCWVVDLILRKE